MGLIARIRERRRDMATLTGVLQGAERHAVAGGDEMLGAHHLLLAAIDMEDGTAVAAFEAVGADPGRFAAAIEAQHAEALRRVGWEPVDMTDDMTDDQTGEPADEPAGRAADGRGPTFMRSDATFEAALTGTRERHTSSGGDLLGCHIVAAVASVEHGVSARALEQLDIDRAALVAAAEKQGGRS